MIEKLTRTHLILTDGILIDYLFFLFKINNDMKKFKNFYRVFMAIFLMLFFQVLSFAQDSAASSTTSTTTTTTSSFVVQPWMWIVGGIVVLLIIIALVSGRSKEKVVITKERTIE